jgi:hypothetical protein
VDHDPVQLTYRREINFRPKTFFTAFSPGRFPTWASERAHHVFFQVDIRGFEDPCLRQCIGVSLGHADVLAGQPVVVDGHPHVAVLEVEDLSLRKFAAVTEDDSEIEYRRVDVIRRSVQESCEREGWEPRDDRQSPENLCDVDLETIRSFGIEFVFLPGLKFVLFVSQSCLVASPIPRGERMASRRRGKGRRKVGRKKRRMRSRIRHRKK